MNDKLEMSMNELSHYESLKKQDLENRKLIKKLQLEIKKLKQGQSLPIIMLEILFLRIGNVLTNRKL